MCTGIFAKAENGDWVYSRTLEFRTDLLSFNLLFTPRASEYKSLVPNGISWKTRYAHVGFAPFQLPLHADGINDSGLAAGAFYFPGWAEYQKVLPNEQHKALSNIDLVSWLLSSFATVEEACNALSEIKVMAAVLPEWGTVPPLHYFIADATGDRAVIEYVQGERKIYRPKIATITNAPTYDWHTLNLRNYIGLKAINDPAIAIQGQELAQLGMGSGSLGLPGDFTPPSRFVRASYFNATVLPEKNGQEQAKRAFKILNQFDIPKGSVREMEGTHSLYEETQWTSAADLTGRSYYFHTATSRAIRSVSLNAIQATTRVTLSVNDPETVIDLSSHISDLNY